jgi:hypothetical protein
MTVDNLAKTLGLILLTLLCACSCIEITYIPRYAGTKETEKYKLSEIDFSKKEVYFKDTVTPIYRMDKNVL